MIEASFEKKLKSKINALRDESHGSVPENLSFFDGLSEEMDLSKCEK